MNVDLPDEAATIGLAETLYALLPEDVSGWTVLLEGELGAGKSTFARALIRAMGHEGPVPSPTYTLVEPYQLSGKTIYHIDLFRITVEEELRYLGWSELDDGLRLVEWPERAPQLGAQADLLFRLDYRGTGRRVEVDGLSARGQILVERLAAAMN